MDAQTNQDGDSGRSKDAEGRYSKTDILQVLLDTQLLAGDLFDAVEAESFVLTPALLARVGNVAQRLGVLHGTMVQEYVLSGRASDDLLAGIRGDLLRQRRKSGHNGGSG